MIKGNFSNILPPPNNTNRFAHYSSVIISDEYKLQSNHEKFKQYLHRYPTITREQNFTNDKSVSYKLISDIGRPYY